MPRLLSNRKPVARPEDLKSNRWDYLNLQNAQPALGLAPSIDEGYTLQTDENGKVTWTNTLGNMQFEEQTITGLVPDTDISIDNSANGNILLSPLQKVQINGDGVVTGDFTVQGNPLGTFPIVPRTLYVTPDGDDNNDGTALDASRACRTISGAVRSPYYTEGTTIRVSAGAYFEDNPIPLKPYTSVVGNDLRTTFVEPLNKDLDLFWINSGCYIAFMQMRNLRRGSVERYAPGGAGTYTTGAYCVAFPPKLEDPIDVYYSPYVQNCTNQSGPWLKDGTMFVPNQTVQIPLGAGTSTWTANATTITVTLYTGTVEVGMAINDEANEGYRNAQLLLQTNKSFLQSQVTAWVNETYPDLTYDEAKCYRDVGYIVEAVARDSRMGGNKRSIEAGLSYWSGNDISLIDGEKNETANAIAFLKDLALHVVANSATTLTLYNTSTSQIINTSLGGGEVVSTRIADNCDLISAIVLAGESAVPEVQDDLLGLIYPTGISPNNVKVASTVTDVNMIAANTYEVTLSSPTVAASDNARIYFGYTTTYPYLDADVPTEWTSGDNPAYADRRLDPTGSGGGALVDGNAPSERSPIQSFVFDAFTQLNQGGNGIHIINNGYAQLVSVFTIFCSNAVIVENGGIASITNSNSNFGDTCMTAKGLGKLASQGFVRNPAYPTNVENGEYYPLGYWPQRQEMEVFLPSDRDRPHIGQVMEVVAPDTYIDYAGNRVPYVNEAGYPGYLVATSNTGTITTGSYTISGIDVSNIAIGHNLYIRDVYGSEVHPESGQPYVTTGTQVVDVQFKTVVLDRPILNGYSDSNLNFFNLYFAGNAYYTVLSSRIDDSLSSTVTNQVTLVPGQETTTSLAVSYAKDLALRVIQNVPITGYVYDKTKCARDTGIIVDTVVSDLMFSGVNGPYTQANFSGLQYWNQDGYVGEIASELTTTTNAIKYVKELARNVVLGITTSTPYQSTLTQDTSLPVATSVEAAAVRADFQVIVDILTNGTAGVTDDVVANGIDIVGGNAQYAYDLLQANKAFIQAEAVAYVESTKDSEFVYDQEKCLRDVGYMVDSVAHDILYGGNRQAIQSGVFYYGFSDTQSAVDGEQVQTAAAYNRLKEIIPSIVTNVAITPTINNTFTQVTTITSSTSVVGGVANSIISLITDIIADGPSASIEGLPIGQSRSTDVDTENAARILLANRDFIKAEVVAWVDKYYGTGFVYDQAKCYRDTGLIVDAIATDLLYPTDEKSQTTFAGLQYWNQAGYTGEINRELTTTTNAIRYVRDLAAQVVQGITTGTRYQSTVTQNVASTPGTDVEAEIVANDFDVIIDILVDGTAGVTDKIVPNGVQSDTTTTIDAYTILVNNKNYIQHETIAFIEATKFNYDETKCSRDSGLIVDAIALDLLYPTDTYSQSTFAGLQYWDQGGYTGIIEGELTTTTNAINYLSDLAQRIVQNDTGGVRYQSDVSQNTSLDPATATEAGLIADDFTVITDILTGGTAGVTDVIVPNGISESTSTDVINAYNLLILNKDYLIAETIAYVEAIKTAEFEYDQTLCARDTGYMIDSVAFDLLHGGNKQAVQSGVYYYTFDANSTAIPNEIPQTLQAFNFIKELAQRVVTNTTGTNYQTGVAQDTSLPAATTFESELLGRAVNVITNIISDGPSVAYSKTPISLDASDNANKLRAALILEANRDYIRAETVAFVNQTQRFEYDQALCFRDVGYMIDSVAFDLLHPRAEGVPSNRQAVQSGVYYYGFSDTASAIASEIPQTTAAYKFIKELMGYVITGETVTPQQPFITQTTATSVGTSNEVLEAQANIDMIISIINNGPGVAFDKVPVALSKDTDPNVTYAYDLLLANRQFIQEETIAYINNNFKYGSYQSNVGQVFDYELTGGERAITSLEEKFDIISGIIKDGADSSPAIRKPRQYVDSDQGVLNAKRLLEKNRNFIQEEVVAYVDNLWPSKFSYDPAKCSRDTGLIVDALAQDIMFEGNSQSTFAGIQYWNQGLTVIPGEQTTTTNAVRYLKDIATKVVTNDTTGYRFYDGGYTYDRVKCARDTGLIVDAITQDLLFAGTSQSIFAGIQYWTQGEYTGAIGSEITTTTNAIEYLKTIAAEVVTNTTGTRYQSTVTQYVGGTPATSTEASAVSAEFDIILDILANGVDGVTDLIEPNGITVTSDPDVANAYAALIANKEFMQTEVVAYVESTKAPGFVYDQAKCYRDVGYMVDSIAFDLRFGGNKQAVQSGVYYYSYGESTAVPNELVEVTAAYDFIKGIVPYIVSGATTTTYQKTVTQTVSASTGSTVEIAALQNYVDIITNIINNGASEVVDADKQPISLTRSSTSTVVNAAVLMNANREFIKAETIAYIDNKFNAGFVYDQSKCERDTGLIVDSIAFDLLYEGDTQSTFAGLQYWNQNGYTGLIGSELTTTSNAIAYVRDAVVAIANTVSSTVSADLAANFNKIIYILNTGTNGVTDAVVPNGVASTDVDVVAVYNAILANKSTIQTATTDWIDTVTTGTFAYNTATCQRDVGYIIDSVAFDLLHGGNRQSIMSGVYYYDFNAESTTIRNEIPQTTAAYNYIRSIVDDIIVGNQVLTPYQNTVRQATDLPAGSATESALAQAKIDIITDIINNGPGSYTREPIALTASTSTDVVEAFNMLLANREFIVAETIAYLETTFNAVSTQIANAVTPTDAIVTKVQSGFDYIIDILENGTDGITDRIVPNSLDQSEDTTTLAAYNALQANKRHIQNEIVAYVDQMNNFMYDRDKCARDTGLIVDAIALDMKYPTTGDSQSTFAGLQYWNQDGYTGDILRELTTTTDAINYLSSLAQKVVVNSKTGTRYQSTITQTTSTLVGTAAEAAIIGNNFTYITDILTNGPAGITDIIVPNGRPINSASVKNAYDLLVANKEYLQAEVVAWVEANRDGAYDRSKCFRDSGIIVDSVISDILFPTDGNSQSTFAGLQYWNQNGYTGLIADELTTTTNAINYINSLAQKVVLNDLSGTRYQVLVSQTTGTVATEAEAMIINNEFSIITNILTNGTAGVTDLVIGNGITASTDADVNRAYNLLQANKEYLQAEAIAFVEATKEPGFTYDGAKCARDIGYMVDSVSFDLLYGGNRQAVQSGVYYYSFNGSDSAIPNDTAETLLAFEHIKEISQQIVTNTTVTTYQSLVKQVQTLDASNTSTAALVGDKYDIITGIITDGPGVAADKEPINIVRASDGNLYKAAALLKANREFIQAETIAFIEETIAFKYDQDKCFRDVGYIVDSIAFDLRHGGNKQSIQSGVYYYGYDATSTAINNEIPQTTAAYNRIKEIIPFIVQGEAVTVTEGNTEKQITYMLPATLTEARILQAKVDRITDIINNGPSAAPAMEPIGLTASSSELVDRAYDLIMANKDFIKAEVVAYVNSQFCGFEYDREKCFRDVGYMLDSVSFDLLYGGNKQAIQSGVYYYGHDADSTAIPKEIPQTTAAYNFIERIVGDIVTGTAITQPQQYSVAQTTSIGNLFYSVDKCQRDTGILVDSFVTDLLFADNGYTQSNFSGLQYWNQAGYTGVIASELTTTTNAIRYLAELAQEVVVNDFRQPALRYQNTVTQVTNANTATFDQVNRVAAEFDIIVDILTNGTAGVTDRVEANGIEAVSDDAQAAYDLLIANKDYLAAEVVAWVELNKAEGFEYDKIKCARDVGYIVDSVAFDILYGGNRQAIHSGVYYYGFSASASAIPTDLVETLAAYTRLREILPAIVTNEAITRSPNNTLTQVTSLTTSTIGQGVRLQEMVDLVTSIITNGPDVAETQQPVSLTMSTSTEALAAVEILMANRDFIQQEIISYINYTYYVAGEDEAQMVRDNVNWINQIIEFGPDQVTVKEPISITETGDRKMRNAAYLLKANRDFIRAETIAFINNTYQTGFLYDKTKCQRDTGLIVDSIAFDLLHDGVTESTFAGLQYWNQDTYVGSVRGEITTTTNAIRYIKELVANVVVNDEIAVTTGNTSTQNTSLPASTTGVAGLITANVDIMLDILANGTAGVTDIIVPDSVASTRTDINNAYDLLMANKEFIQDEVIARIDYDNDGFDYDRTVCRRDVGYIVDSLAFDLLHEGNRQSVTSGVYYYGFNARDTVIDDQVPQTTAAYNRIKELVASIVKGEAITGSNQYKVKQVFGDAVATDAEVTALQAKVDVITDIINNGPSVAGAQTPIDHTASTDANVVNAFNLLLANRAFIQAEVTAYIDAVYTDTPNYDRDKCYRDVAAIVDAVSYDLVYGGNYNSVNTGNGYFNRKGQYHIVRLEQNVGDPTLFVDGATVRFYQQSYISASGYLFEYVGAGTQYGALPQVGKADPVQEKEVVQLNNGKVFFTSTDQNGDFRIGPTLVISQATGVLSGRTFQKSLYAEMTPFILVVGA